MLAALLIAAASSLTAPQAPATSPIRIEDYPDGATLDGQKGAVVFNLGIDPQGKPMTCNVEDVIGVDFSKLTCRRFMNARFKPAADRNGQPTFGSYRTVMNFWLPDPSSVSDYPRKLAPETTLKVKPVRGLTSHTEVKVIALIDSQAKVTECEGAATADARLVTTACQRLKSEWKDKVRTDGSGKPVAFVRALTIAFEPEA